MPDPSNSGTLHIERNSDLDIKMRGLDILVDGELVGNVDYGKTLNVRLAPGEHRIKITNTLYSKQEDFDLAAGETVSFEVANVISGMSGFMFAAVGFGPYKVSLRRI